MAAKKAKPARPARRSYGEDDRAAALAAYIANGRNLRKTAADLGIPRNTLARWVEELPPPAAPAPDPHVAASLAAPKKGVAAEAAGALPAACGTLANKLETIAHALANAAEDKISTASLSAVMVSLGIAVEKMRLLRDQSTANIDLTVFTDEQLERLDQVLGTFAVPPPSAN